MDASVERAMVQWPNVPDCYGWLRLDRRGNWLIRDERVVHPKLIDFIGRNYLRLDDGGYVFQNGPQRVHVALDYAPFVLRSVNDKALQLETHTAEPIGHFKQAWLDDNGQLLLQWQQHTGLLDDRDMSAVLPHIQAANGQVLDEDTLLAALSDPKSTQALVLRIGQQLIPIRHIQADLLGPQLGFVAQPHATPQS